MRVFSSNMSATREATCSGTYLMGRPNEQRVTDIPVFSTGVEWVEDEFPVCAKPDPLPPSLRVM